MRSKVTGKELAWVHRPQCIHYVDPSTPTLTACKKVIKNKDWPRSDDKAAVTCGHCKRNLRPHVKAGFSHRQDLKPFFR